MIHVLDDRIGKDHIDILITRARDAYVWTVNSAKSFLPYLLDHIPDVDMFDVLRKVFGDISVPTTKIENGLAGFKRELLPQILSNDMRFDA